MSYRCFVCSKGPVTGKTISHSHRKTNRRFSPNLQRLRIMVGSQPRRVYVCTTCLHSNRIKKAP